ncbi:Short chain dehydrogenase [Colletotrichum higginsianum IMI 349063]|uniref:Short chain dehydrogenase n=3 Tax=Colletotrichum higginsianum TaxID=80884 RepID=A0A1B7XTF0_COLHI|nr:Short chain dehydrogenase [Colletotrichum higginsianum IMI 349063]OBR03041.1 Short chain dehydrogenase [Colletotrichum higginsianum IMI 349063]TIC91214.1 hypothetical protein CH35J_011138 [Colletotrichum higginsianum]
MQLPTFALLTSMMLATVSAVNYKTNSVTAVCVNGNTLFCSAGDGNGGTCGNNIPDGFDETATKANEAVFTRWFGGLRGGDEQVP